jgi:hypothetical protein
MESENAGGDVSWQGIAASRASESFQLEHEPLCVDAFHHLAQRHRVKVQVAAQHIEMRDAAAPMRL